MNKPNYLGILPQILSGISFNSDAYEIRTSDYYKVAESIFRYLCNSQKQNGSIYDSNTSSTLDMQYHQTNFSLSALILYILNRDEKYHITAYKSLQYFIDIPTETKKPASDFNNFPILLSYMLLYYTDRKNVLKGLLEDYIAEMPNYASINQEHTYGNNFITIRALNQLLRFKLFGEKGDFQSAHYLMESSLKWQFDDGIFYDYPRYFNYQQGIPSLTYHSKITLITLLFGLVSKENYIIDKAMSGLEALVTLTNYDGEAFYYGRTNNALYGYACGILALRIASNFVKKNELSERYKQCEEALFRFCSRHKAKDGHLYIVPNDLEDQRCGFDNYMFVIVYNAFIMSMLLLSSTIKENPSPVKNDFLSEFHHFQQSGFIIRKSEKISIAFNLKGHNYYQHYRLDPRFTCCTPLLLKFNGHDILPTVPFSSPIYPRNIRESRGKKILRKFRELGSEFKSWGYLKDYNPLHAGFIPFLETKNKWYMPILSEEAEIFEMGDLLTVKILGKFISIRRKGLLCLSIFIADMMKNIINIPFPELTDMLIRESDSYFERSIIIHDHFIHFSDKIWGCKSGKVCFNLRTYSDGYNKVRNNQFIFEKNGYGFALLLEKGMRLRESKNLCSSKGKAIYWDLIKEEDGSRKNCQNTISLMNAIIPFDRDNDLEKSISLYKSISKHFINIQSK